MAGAELFQTVLRRAAARTPGVRRLRRPSTTTSPAFDLAYARLGSPGVPVLVIPGGPGLASVLPYRGFRRRAAAQGLDVIMVEHRGVGLSRTTPDGRDLPPSALTIDQVLGDLEAVLDDARVSRVVVYGSSYGSYLAQAFGARHPERVAAMVLDSPHLGPDDVTAERNAVRAALWDGTEPGPGAAATAVRRAVAEGEEADALRDVGRLAHELGGPELAARVVASRRRGTGRLARAILDRVSRRTWTATHPVPCWMEFDLVGTIAFREMQYAPPPDGGPLDPALTYAPLAAGYPPYIGHPVDLVAALPGFGWPVVVLSGCWDLRTPPATARRIVELAPQGQLVELTMGHSALESHPSAALAALQHVAGGEQARTGGVPQERSLAEESPPTAAWDALPRRGVDAWAPAVLRALTRA